MIGSIRCEVLDHVLILSEAHAGQALADGRIVDERALWSHFPAMYLRCQARSVPGVTAKTSRQRRRGIKLETAAGQDRSAGS